MVHHSGSCKFSIRKGKWKLIDNIDDVYTKLRDFELYDLNIDPMERDNLSERYPEKVENLVC